MPLLTGYVPIPIATGTPADSLFQGGRTHNQNQAALQVLLDATFVLPVPAGVGDANKYVRVDAGGTDYVLSATTVGAHAATHEQGGGDDIVGENLDVSTFAPATWSVGGTGTLADQLGGIDALLALIGDPATLLNGATPVLANALNVNSKRFNGGSGEPVFDFSTTGAAAVNYLRSRNAAATFPVVFDAQGTDANIGITVLPKGSGRVLIFGHSYRTVNYTSDPMTLTVADGGKTVLHAGTPGGEALELPLASTCPSGWYVRVTQVNAVGAVDVTPQGADLLEGVNAALSLSGGAVSRPSGVFFTDGTEWFLDAL